MQRLHIQRDERSMLSSFVKSLLRTRFQIVRITRSSLRFSCKGLGELMIARASDMSCSNSSLIVVLSMVFFIRFRSNLSI